MGVDDSGLGNTTGGFRGMTTIFRAAVELRDGAGDSPGRLTGTLMRYGSPGQHGRETFAPGSPALA